MDSALQFLALVFHTAAALTVCAGIVWLVRSVRRASRTLGLIMACGLLLRAGIALTFFWIGARNLPILQSLRTPEGVWTFALDSARYLRDASTMVEEGYFAAPAGLAPEYVVWLTAWMHLLGTSGITAPLLNLTLFAAVVWLIVKAAPPVGRDSDDLPQLAMVGSLAFSPALLLHGSQALKDDLSTALIAVACVGALYLFGREYGGAGRSRMHFIGLFMMLGSGYLLFGLRNYAAGLVGAATVVALVLPAAFRATTLRTIALWSGAVLLVVGGAGIGIWMGIAGDAASAMLDTAWQQGVELGTKALLVPDDLRHGFHQSGGNTNLAPGPVPEPGSPVVILTWPERTRALVTGIAATFVPMTLLQASGAVELGIGASLRLAIDLDTLFLDTSIVVSLVLLLRRRPAVRWHRQYVCFALALAVITCALMAYIVTNFGTLFRLRVMLAVPIWMLGLAISRGPLPEIRRVRYEDVRGMFERN